MTYPKVGVNPRAPDMGGASLHQVRSFGAHHDFRRIARLETTASSPPQSCRGNLEWTVHLSLCEHITITQKQIYVKSL